MELKKLINWLEKQPAHAVVAYGFGEPMSYRGYYDQVAFDPVQGAKIGDMLIYARNALGATFTGYKGGDFTMKDDTPCWISEYGRSSGDMIGPTLLGMWQSAINEQI
jgi:hypothetical protein